MGHFDQLGDVLFGVADKGQDRHHGNPGVDSGICQGAHGRKTGRGGRRAGFDLPGKIIIRGGDRKTDGGVDLVDLCQQVDIAEDQVGLGDDMDGEVVFGDHFQGPAAKLVFAFDRHIGIVHRAKTNGAAHPLAGQGIGQQINSVDFDMDIGKILDLVALGARVAVDALVLAAPVQVHIVFQAEVGIGLLDVVEDGLGVDFRDHGVQIAQSSPTGGAAGP